MVADHREPAVPAAHLGEGGARVGHVRKRMVDGVAGNGDQIAVQPIDRFDQVPEVFRAEEPADVDVADVRDGQAAQRVGSRGRRI